VHDDFAGYRQLSASVKLINTEYKLVPSPSTPEAICCGVVESGTEPLHVPVPLPPETDAEPQFTRTAETGIVGHPENELDPTCTLRLQFWELEPPDTIQLRFAGEEPDTVPASGLLA
jgi:hypothetical protein